MNRAKFMEIIQEGNLVIPMFFLKNYKKFSLELEEFMFLMYLYHLGNKSPFNPSKYQEDLGMDLSTVMKLVEVLTDKKMIRVEVLKGDKGLREEVVVLDDFYQKVSFLLVEEENEKKEKNDSNIFEVIEKEFGRTLSSMEYEIIKAWLDNDISEELIKEALKEAVLNGVTNFRYMDKILYEWGKNHIKTSKDVEEMRNKRNKKMEKDKEKDSNIDLDLVDWNWFDDEE